MNKPGSHLLPSLLPFHRVGAGRAPNSPPSSLSPPFACPANGCGRLALSQRKDYIICNVYPDTHAAAWEDKRRRGSQHSWPEGVYNQVIEPEPEPSRNGGVNGSREPGPSEINLSAGWLSRTPLPPALAWGCLTLSPQLQVQIWEPPPGPFDFKCPDGAPLGAAANRWGALEQGLECASEGIATGITSRRCWLRRL